METQLSAFVVVTVTRFNGSFGSKYESNLKTRIVTRSPLYSFRFKVEFSVSWPEPQPGHQLEDVQVHKTSRGENHQRNAALLCAHLQLRISVLQVNWPNRLTSSEHNTHRARHTEHTAVMLNFLCARSDCFISFCFVFNNFKGPICRIFFPSTDIKGQTVSVSGLKL